MSRPRLLALAAAIVAAGLFLAVTPSNPPGFYRDESALAYNAYTISQSGHDEYGATMPLFFRSFGDYKSPVYVYLLAGVDRVTGPSIVAARALSAVLGLLAVLAVGLLAARLTGRLEIGALVTLLAALDPWLFEVTRVAFEVALLPLAIVLFLLAALRAHRRGCPWPDGVLIGLALGLVTYTYPAGRLLGPLFALGLALLAPSYRWIGVGRAWAAYAVTLVPLAVFDLRHPGSLSSRFGVTSYLEWGASPLGLAHRFVVDYLRDVSPWAWAVHGDPNPRHHVHGMGSLLVGTIVLAAIGIVLAAARHRSDPWWRFAAYGLVVSPVPGAITFDRLHSLRMVAFPIFLLLFAALALDRLLVRGGGRRAVAVAAIVAVLAQGAVFQWEFRDRGPHRREAFEAAYPRVLAAAAARPGPIYVFADDHTSIHAYWYAVLRHVPVSRIRRLEDDSRPPPGATVLRAGEPCAGCRVLGSAGRFVAYVRD